MSFNYLAKFYLGKDKFWVVLDYVIQKRKYKVA